MVKVINVKDTIKNNLDHEDGSRLYHAIKSSIKDDKIVLDFSDVEIVTSSFLNTSFRILTAEYGYDFLKEHLQIKNTNSSINRMIKDCVDSVRNAETSPINSPNYLDKS